MTQRLQLDRQTLLTQRLHTDQTTIADLCDRWKITELALFGSVLRDDFHPNSDIDLLVTFHPDAKITFFQLDAIERDFSQHVDRPVDVVTRTAIETSHNPIRRQNILGNMQVIYPQ
jgi:hypothetical protein